ncbi:MAG: HAMP domain-containing protein [Candidatus Aenigmarchaeota archaeon]|nr:HAMP domain-containing protein [Candidatus Aenigmarchaeota archaeon]
MNIKSIFFGLENKIVTSFLILSFVMFIVIFSSMNTYNKIYEDFSGLKENSIPGYIALGNIESNTLKLTIITHNFMIYGEPGDMDNFEEISSEISKDIYWLKENELFSYGDSEVIEEKTKEVMNSCASAIDVKENNASDGVLSLKRKEILEKQENLNSILNKYIDSLEKEIHLKEEKVYDRYYNGINNMLFANLAVLLFALMVGLYVSRSIVVPIIMLRKSTTRIAEGDLGSKLACIKSNDEIEDLARAFDQMTRQLILSKQKVQHYADNLEVEVEKKTAELKKKIGNEKRTTNAMMHIMLDFKKTNRILKEKERELELQAEELADRTAEAEEKRGMYEIANKQLFEAHEELKKFNQTLKEKIEERTRSLRKEKERIEQFLKEKNDFIIRLSHDLRTPLTPLTTLLPILERELTDEKQKKYVCVCNENIKYMKNLVLGTLNMARLDTGVVSMSYKETDVRQIIYEFIEANSIEYNKKNIKLLNKTGKLPPVFCDETRIMEVIQNICSNAVKYSPEGGPITFRSDIDKKYIIIKIKDSGMGMKGDLVKKMFEEFYRGDPSRHDLSCGLGMAISRRIIQSHGGKIWAESKGPGKGSTISFSLPLKRKRKIINIK